MSQSISWAAAVGGRQVMITQSAVPIYSPPAWPSPAPALPVAVAGEAYTATLPAPVTSDDETPVVSISGLPPGLALTGLTIAGTPTAGGAFALRLTATDKGGEASIDLPLTVSIAVPVLPAPQALPDAVVGAPYHVTLRGATGIGVTYFVQGLPAGLSFEPSTLTISGTPAASATLGVAHVTLMAANSAGQATEAMSMGVDAKPAASAPPSQGTPAPIPVVVPITVVPATASWARFPYLGGATVGQRVTLDVPAAVATTGHTITGYATGPGFPSGWTFDPKALTITGTPSMVGTNGNLFPLVATSSDGSHVDATFVLDGRSAPLPASELVAPLNFSPLGAGTIAQVFLINEGATALTGGYRTFGMPLPTGALPKGSGLVAAIAHGAPVPAQVDVQSTYADGSARFAAVTVPLLGVAPGVSTLVVLSPATTPTMSAPSSAGFALKGAQTATLTITPAGAAPIAVDLTTLLAAPTSDVHLSGGFVVETRARVALFRGVDLVIDRRVYADGSWVNDVTLSNVKYDAPGWGNVVYAATLVDETGATQFSFPTVNHFAGQSWHFPWRNAPPPAVHVQFDMPAWVKIGASPSYGFARGIAKGNIPTALGVGSTYGPLGSQGVTLYMPTTGGRPDIGIQPAWVATWALSQDSMAHRAMLQQAEAAPPWECWSGTDGEWANVLAHPTLQLNPGNSSGVIAVYAAQNATGSAIGQPLGTSYWTVDVAHQPDLYFQAWLSTGTRYYHDRLQAQAAFGIGNCWTGMRNNAVLGNAPDNVLFGAQGRGGAWTLRQVQEAAAFGRDADKSTTYLRQVANDNYSWLGATAALLAPLEGELAGFLPAINGSGINVAPWQCDFLAMVTAQGALMGYAGARTWCAFAANWTAGRFTELGPDAGVMEAPVYDPSTSNNGQIWWSSAKGGWQYPVMLQTWHALREAFITYKETNVGSSAPYWSGWGNGEQGNVALAALAALATALPDHPALVPVFEAGCDYGYPYTSLGDFQTQPTWNLVPAV